MDERLRTGLTKLINKHFSAVQTDTELGLAENDNQVHRLTSRSRNAWNDFNAAEKEFKGLLEQCTLSPAKEV